MSTIQVEVEPAEAGFDPQRLERLDRHFARYVDAGKLAGWLAAVTRHGKVVHLASAGRRNIEMDLPVETDTIYRIYSMTKPITSVAVMMLYEEGRFELTDPIHRFIDSFRHQRVFRGGSLHHPATSPASEPVRIWHLLSHTAGLTYDFAWDHPVDGMYRAAGFDLLNPPDIDLAAACDLWASMPLLFEPGTRWNYSVATDILGRLIEVVSGQPLDEFFSSRIFGPLAMTDTAFCVPEEKRDRLATLYLPGPPPARPLSDIDSLAQVTTTTPKLLSGGGGLTSTLADYHRFTRFLLNRGELDGIRLLGPVTMAYMTRNHLPDDHDLAEVGRPIFADANYHGIGFGLGFSVVTDPVAAKVLCSPGQFGWGGAASTTFWVDPVESVTAIFLTQLLPTGTYPIDTELQQLVYQALVGRRDPAPAAAGGTAP